MLQNINIFKLITIAISILLGIVALLIFSGKFPGVSSSATTNQNKPVLNVWGTIDREYVDKAMLLTTQNTGKPFQFNYVEYGRSEIESKIIEANARGNSPDIILAESEIINAVASTLYILPYTYMDEATYKNMFIDVSHTYATPYGAQMYPVLADPLIMYYNKKMFRESGVTNAPSSWLELPSYGEKLTIKNEGSAPKQSAFGIGANNVTYNKDILLANLLQLGHNPAKIYYSLSRDNALELGYSNDLGTASSDGSQEGDIYKILRFQTAFSDPQKTVYTWSELGDSDYEKFVAGTSAIYFGRASDYYKIIAKNPNLEFSVQGLPQFNGKYKVTTGDLVGVAVSNKTKDFPYSIEISQAIAGKVFGSALSGMLGMSSARKDILAGNDGSERSVVIGGGAIIMQNYYAINSKVINGLFKSLYENIISGRKSVEKSVEVFERDFVNLYKR